LACINIMNIDKEIYSSLTTPMNSHINVGSGSDITIKELAYEISKCVGFEGIIEFDDSKPDGVMQKLMDNSKLSKIGWKKNITLAEGLKMAYSDYKKHKDMIKDL